MEMYAHTFKHTFCPYCWEITWHLLTIFGTWLCLACRAAGREKERRLKRV